MKTPRSQNEVKGRSLYRRGCYLTFLVPSGKMLWKHDGKLLLGRTVWKRRFTTNLIVSLNSPEIEARRDKKKG